MLDPDSTVPALTDGDADARARRRRRHSGRSRPPTRSSARSTRRAGSCEGAMSYTLRGRLESRLASLLLPLAACCAARGGAAPLVAARAVGDDGRGRCRARPPAVSPAAALPARLGRAAARAARARADARARARARARGAARPGARTLRRRVGCGQVLGQACFPLLRLSYATDGGELGRLGVVSGSRSVATLATAGGFWWLRLPPTVHLSAGVHQGPLVIDRRETLVGDRGAIVRGGIVIRADGVTVKNVTVIGGENGIVVDGVRRRRSRRRRHLRVRARRHPRPARGGDDRELLDRQPRQHLRPGDRHLLRLRQADEPRHGLHDRRRPGGDRRPLREHRHDGQPDQPHDAARDLDDRDVDGDDRRATRSATRRESGSSATTTRCA